MSGLLEWLGQIGPDWFSAVGTVGALLVALVLLGFQLTDRRSEASQRRRAQAELIAAALDWSDKTREPMSSQRVLLFNASGNSVYSVVVGAVHLQGAGVRTIEEAVERTAPDQPPPISTAAVLPPGKFRTTVRSVLHSMLGARPAAEIAFTDAAGRHWIRRAAGQLEELKETPLRYFAKHGLCGPHELTTPDPID